MTPDAGTRAFPGNVIAPDAASPAPMAFAGAKLRSLQALRAVAALLVLFSHDFWLFHTAKPAFAPLNSLFRDGVKGVDLFFVLSGFIITFIHAADWGRPQRIANYAFNRLSRIYPMVWIMSAFAIVVYVTGFGGADKAYKVVGSWNYIASFLLLPQKGDALVGVTWTLKYEIFFYFLFAFLLVNRRLGSAVLVIWQLTVVAVALLGYDYKEIWGGYYLRPMCIEFGIGMLCGLVAMRSLRRCRTDMALPFVALLAGATIFVGEALRETYLAPALPEFPAAIVFGGSAGLIVLSLVILEAAGRVRVANWLVKLGDSSYAMYLVHYSLIGLSVALIVKLHLPVNNGVCIIVALLAIGAGLVFNELVDQPLQRLLRQAKVKFLGPSTRTAANFESPSTALYAGDTRQLADTPTG